MWLQVFYLQVSYLKQTDPLLCCTQATSAAISPLQCEYLPTDSTSLCLSAHTRPEWLERKSWYNLFFDEQVLTFRPSRHTQQDVASAKNFSEPSLCRGRVIGNKNTGSFKSWRDCCQETFAAGQPWKQTTQLPRTLPRFATSNCVNIFSITAKDHKIPN